MRKLFLSILFFFPAIVYSQQPIVPSLIQPVSPSPNAASLGKYCDLPVGKYTGVPEINVPIWEIVEGDIHVPISISYHASGIRVEENASWVGLGWALNSGGVVTRAVRGKPDEKGYLLNPAYNLSTTGRNNQIPSTFLNPYQQLSTGSASACDVVSACDYANESATEVITSAGPDSEPDMFYFNFNGLSGKFVLDQNNKAYSIPFQKIKIQPADINLTRWTITDESGMVYTFSDIETTVSNSLSYSNYGGSASTTEGRNLTCISAWYLTKIKSPKGHVVTFEYDHTEDYYTYSGQSQHVIISAPNPLDQNDSPPYYPKTTGTQSHFPQGVRLAKIKFSNGQIDFNPSAAPRQDITDNGTTYSLASIIISNYNNGALSPIKQFTFDTDYFQTNDENQNFQTKRLRLNSIKECSGDGSLCKPPYIFSYDQTRLPSKISTGQDHWGFYNGKENTNVQTNAGNVPTLIPSFTQNTVDLAQVVDAQLNYFNAVQLPSTTVNPETYALTFIGADRSPDFNFAKACVLKSITYPTGGITTYKFEPNDFYLGTTVTDGTNSTTNGIVGGLRIKQITQDPASGTGVPITKTYAYRDPATPANSSGVILDSPIYTDDYTYTAAGINANSFNGGPITISNSLANLSVRLKASAMLSESAPAILFTSGSKFELGQTNGSFVGYGVVQEAFCSDPLCTAQPNGKKIYRYTTGIDYRDVNTLTFGWCIWDNNYSTPCTSTTLPSQYNLSFGALNPSIGSNTGNLYPYPPKNSYDWKRGLSISEEFYDNNGVAQKIIQSSYNLVTDPTNSAVISGIKMIASPVFTNDVLDFSVIYYGRYDNLVAWNYKTKDVVTENDGQGNLLVTTTNYYYDNPSHAQVTRVEFTDGQGNLYSTRNQYPTDFSSPPGGDSQNAYDRMISYNMIAKPIRTSSYKNGATFLQSSMTNYQTWSPNNAILPSSIQTTLGTNPPDTRMQFNRYNSLGEVLEQQKASDVKHTNLWGYNGAYPVAEVIGADYATVSSFITQSALDNANGQFSDDQIRVELAKIRTGLASQGIKALVTTYTYAPLIGVTSKTDSNGETIYYEYDLLNRLTLIKDMNGNIVKQYTYNYAIR